MPVAPRSRRTLPALAHVLPVALSFALAITHVTALAQQRLSAEALQQLGALHALKSNWTPVQQKCSAALLFEVQRRRGGLLNSPLRSLRSNVAVNDDGTVFVDIQTQVTADVLRTIESVGGAVVSSHPRFNAVRALVPLDQVEAIATLPEVRFVGPLELA